jgi:dTDP-4-dehydrorhamnose reductase
VVYRKKILVFGGTGMLGSKLVETFSSSKKFDLSATFRELTGVDDIFKNNPDINWIPLEINGKNSNKLKNLVGQFDFVVNAIGAIPQKFDSKNIENLSNIIFVNSLFPSILDNVCADLKIKLYTIGTDCVFSGQRGNYLENDICDPTDLYGVSKFLGESTSHQTKIIRTSIVGFDRRSNASLLNWFLSQPRNAKIDGFENHLWNGITTVHFSKLIEKIIDLDLDLDYLTHFLPSDYVSKYELLKIFAHHFNRKDIEISSCNTPIGVNRVMNTLNQARNQYLWRTIGYSKVPSIDTLIGELFLDYKN